MKTIEKDIFNLEELSRKIQNKSCILVVESLAGVGGDILVRQLLALLIKKGKNVFVTASAKTKTQIINEFLSFNLKKTDVEKRLLIITSVSESGHNIYEVDLRKAFTISSAIKSCFNKCTVGTLGILNTLFFLEKQEATQNFLLELVQDARVHGISLIVPIDLGIWNSASVSFVENLADVIIELREAVSGFKIIRGLRFKKLGSKPPTPFFEYKISENGIIVGDAIE